MKVLSLLFLLATLPSLASVPRSWERFSDPDIMNFRQIHKYYELPLRGKIKNKERLWSGDYWPLNKGNINRRWNSKNKIGFNLNSPSLAEARRMNVQELASLSPSEKYDLYLGRYDYPLKTFVSTIADPKAQSWEGICHGWAPASMNHDEPLPKNLKNPDGIEIPFGSTDIKALLSFYYAHGFQVPNTHQMGKRCDGNVTNCQHDLNAGAFHIVLANRLGLDQESFVIDIQGSQEVWNHPIHSFNSTIIADHLPPSPTSAPYSSKLIRIRTELLIGNEGDNDWQTVLGTKLQSYKKLVYEYDLDIDAYGNIIGGDWRSQGRPDFLWIKDRPKQYAGILSKMKDLLNE